MKTLAIGYGSAMRKDDGIGPWVVRQIEAAGVPGVDVRVCVQLDVELADAFAGYDRVIFVDAAASGKGFTFQRLNEEAPAGGGSHSLSPALLQRLARELFGATPEAYLCTIRGHDFGIGDGFTLETNLNGQDALMFLMKLLATEALYA